MVAPSRARIPSKVDRSAAYAMRWVAKNIVAAGLLIAVRSRSRTPSARPTQWVCSSRLSAPRMCRVDQITDAVKTVFDLRPLAIIRDLELLDTIFRKTAAYGHFGREQASFTWERTDRAEALQRAVRG